MSTMDSVQRISCTWRPEPFFEYRLVVMKNALIDGLEVDIFDCRVGSEGQLDYQLWHFWKWYREDNESVISLETQ